MNANRTKRENEREYIYEQKRKGTKVIVVMASRRRAMKELGRVTFSPDTTSGGGSPRGPLEDSLRGKDILHINNRKNKEEKEKEKNQC